MRRTLDRLIFVMVAANLVGLLGTRMAHRHPPAPPAPEPPATSPVRRVQASSLGLDPPSQPAAGAPDPRSATSGGLTVTPEAIEVPRGAAAPTMINVDLQACPSSPATGAPLTVDPRRFWLLLADGTRVPAQAARQPALLPTAVVAGRCARGWLSFPVRTARAVGLLYDGPPAATWPLR